MISESNNTDIAASTADTIACPPLRKVWDKTKHIQVITKNGTEGCVCVWCGEFSRGVNHTKALTHVSKLWNPAVHVRVCTSIIPADVVEWYRDLSRKTDKKKSKKREANLQIQFDIKENQAEACEMVAAKKAWCQHSLLEIGSHRGK